MQSIDLLGLQRDRCMAPPEADIWMMAFSFREFTNLLNKSKRLPEIAKPEVPARCRERTRREATATLPVKDFIMTNDCSIAG